MVIPTEQNRYPWYVASDVDPQQYVTFNAIISGVLESFIFPNACSLFCL